MNEKKIFDNIFLTSRKICYPVYNKMKEYIILYPTEGYYLTEEQYKSLLKVLRRKDILDDVINIDIETVTKYEDLSDSERRIINSFNFDNYHGKMLLLENAIIDINFKWTISIYQDYWAILYADREIIEDYIRIYNSKKDLETFEREVISHINNGEIKNEFIKLINNSYIKKV